MDELKAAKALARKQAFARRAAVHGTGRDAAAQAHLAQVLAGGVPQLQRSGQGGAAPASPVLAGYMPMRTEIDPLPAMAAHAGPVCVPVIVGKGQPLAFRAWTSDAAMVMGEFGARVPQSGDWLVPSVLIVPLLAFDAQGYRLGYGGGFYDRTLEKLRSAGPVLALGFAFAAQQTEVMPLEPTDQPLDAIVTEAGVRWFGSARG